MKREIAKTVAALKESDYSYFLAHEEDTGEHERISKYRNVGNKDLLRRSEAFQGKPALLLQKTVLEIRNLPA